ncbi:RNA-binding S4 domain-containing protein [Rothia sp. P7181]|uniref:RNA-binding S4 domain-containing protein n=1 Tax=unclassified Rothia (in: high G+C Gram-positive bacteria) TaxID=2689056 RepID=UPI003AE90511
MSNVERIFIRDESIRLGQFLKLAALVENGVHARELIQDGLVKVNGDIEEARGKQLRHGDTVTLNGITVEVASESKQ